MPIFINPDRTNLPDLQDSKINPGLEALTGADICTSRFPLPVNESTLQTHIDRRALFVQIKIGYDACSFDALKNSIARMQAQRIPKSQAVLLCIGSFYSDEDGLLRVVNSKPYGKTKWLDFIMAMDLWEARGGIYSLNIVQDVAELQDWIDLKFRRWEKVDSEGKKEVYPTPDKPVFTPDDIWQQIEELSPDTWEYLLCAGLKGFGIKTVEAVREYFGTMPHLTKEWGFYALKILTDKQDGKLVHNVSGWGNGKADKLRGILGLPDNCNLAISGGEDDFARGWYGALKSFKRLIDEGHSPKDSFNGLMKQTDDFFVPF